MDGLFWWISGIGRLRIVWVCSVNLFSFCEVSVIRLVLCGCGEILLNYILLFFMNSFMLNRF